MTNMTTRPNIKQEGGYDGTDGDYGDYADYQGAIPGAPFGFSN